MVWGWRVARERARKVTTSHRSWMGQVVAQGEEREIDRGPKTLVKK